MAATLPIKTTAEDIDVLANYMKNQVGFVPLDRLRSAVPPPHGDARKIDTMRYLGLLEADNSGVKLTEQGRRYAAATPNERATVLAGCLRGLPLYSATLEWMHYSKVRTPTKTDVANYWVDKHSAALGGIKGAALTDAAVLFLRMAAAAGVGKFVAAGAGRDTHMKVDPAALESVVTGVASAATPASLSPAASGTADTANKGVSSGGNSGPSVSLIPGVNINLEIHIAADASATTIEEIFKNMRKYVLGGSDVEPEDE